MRKRVFPVLGHHQTYGALGTASDLSKVDDGEYKPLHVKISKKKIVILSSGKAPTGLRSFRDRVGFIEGRRW